MLGVSHWRRDPMMPWKTIYAKLDCVFVKIPLFTLIDDCNKFNRIELSSWSNLAQVTEYETTPFTEQSFRWKSCWWSSKNLLFRFAKTNHLDYFPIKRETPLLNEPCQTQPESAEKKVRLGVTCTQEFFILFNKENYKKAFQSYCMGNQW